MLTGGEVASLGRVLVPCSAKELDVFSTTQKVFSNGTAYSPLVKLSPDDETLSLLGSCAPLCNIGKKSK